MFFQAAKLLVPLLAAAVALSACQSDAMMTVQPKDPSERSLAKANASVEPYRLTPGDKIRVSIFELEAVTTEYTVDEAGTISVPPLQPLVVRQKTAKEVASELTDAFAQAGLYREARINVDVLSYGRIYVLGEVAHPGQFDYHPGMSLFAAFASAGGHTYRANKNLVFIRRASDAVETEYEYTTDMAIMPGDVIRVPEIHL